MRKATVIMVVCAATAFATGQVLIEKSLPVSFGVDSHGGNRLEGRFIDARVYSRAWTASEAVAYNGLAGGKTTSVQQQDLASFQQGLQSITASNLIWSGTPKAGDRCDAVGRADFTNGFTFACWVVLNKTGGRLIDNATPGGHDGWIIDTYGDRIRFFRPDRRSAYHPLKLETGKPQCIVVTVAADDGITIWQNGERHRVGCVSHQRYTPIAGGYEITDGEADFSRVLYGWHGNDWKKVPRIFVLTSDRPRVQFLSNPRRTWLGQLSFDCPGHVRYRYVFGRAEYELEGGGRVRMARSAESEDLLVEVTGDIPAKVSGTVVERGRQTRGSKTYYAFNRVDGLDKPPSDLPKAFDDAVARLEALSGTLVVKTPDKELDSVILCENIAMDGVREGDCLGHAALLWRDPFPGWRVSYGLIALGRDEAFRAFARAHFSSQTKEGRVTSNMGMRDSIYSFNEPFVDAVLRYWLRSGDDAFMREVAYEGVKRHLAYMEKYIRVPGTDLYENFLNAWNTDNKWCNGGAGTIASAYARFAYRAMARAASRFGKEVDAAAFAKRADEIDAAIDDSLWSERRGVWGEYREKFGYGRLIDSPDASSIYTAIDSGLADAVPSRAFRALDWYMKNVPSEIGKDGQAVIYSSNKLPRFYSTCGLYQEENLHLALACWQTGEPEIAWRHYRSAYFQTVRGERAGPGAMYHIHDEKTLENRGDFDFTDSLAMHLRSTVEGLFGIVIDGPSGKAVVTPGFPPHWNEAEINTPYFGYRWTRKGGVEVTYNPHGYAVEVRSHHPRMTGVNLPPPHTNWGQPKGEGCDLSVPEGASFACVDLGAAANQNLRTLHARTYTPMTGRHPWCKWGPSTRSIESNGRSWWSERHGGKKLSVPPKFNIPADGIVRSSTGIPFRLDAGNGENAVFTSLYDQLPAMRSIPLSGKGTKIAFLVAVSTNPNIAWTEAARITVTYADGVSQSVSLVPPDNCDDWLSYGTSQPYHLKGEHVQLWGKAHVNVIAVPLDPSKELFQATIECRATETLAGIAAATLCK